MNLKNEILKEYGTMVFVSNLEKSKEFFSSLLGEHATYEKSAWAEFKGEGFKICLQEKEGYRNEQPDSSTRLILQVANIDKATEILKKFGIEIEEEKNPTQNSGRYTNFKDLDGNVFGLYEAP